MLTVYSTHGSPGASTTAMHLAAHWASTGREVLLIEADPAGGSLSHNLGIQFTPGSASFVASGLPALSNHLIDHAQDVLFENLHVMPAPASPAGAHGIFRTFANSAESLRTISENEIAVIIDGGRITTDTAGSELTTGAAGVLVVCRDNSQLSSLKLLKNVLAAGPDDDRPQGSAVTIGKSPMDDEEWRESYGLTFCGAIENVADMTADLSAFLNWSKRKSKKWRISLEQVGENLYPYAQPPASDPSRRLRPATQSPPPGTEPADDADQAAPTATAPVPDPSVAQDPAGHWQAPPTPEPQPSYAQPHYPPPHPQPEPSYEQPHHPPPTPEPQYAQPMAPGPGHGQSQYPPPTPEPQPGHGQSHYLPPTGWLDAPQGYGQPPPPDPQAHGQPPPVPYAPAEYPAPPYEQPQPPGYEQPQPGAYAPTQPTQYPAPSYGQPAAQPQPPTVGPSHGQEPPVPAAQPSPGAEQPEDEPPPTPDIKPTGSFRDWAAKLHGSNADDTAAQNRGV